MGNKKRTIFQVENLEKSYKRYSALKVGKLEIHPGTIYGIVGTVGSGKTSLLNILAGYDKQTSGKVLYDDCAYKTNWRGKIIPHKDVFYLNNPELRSLNQTVSNYIGHVFGNKKNVIQNRYFRSGSFENIWSQKLNKISQGESHWLGMVLSCESDPRVLLIDDYGIYFNTNMEQDFRNQIIKMNRTLGTTLILSSPTDIYLNKFASVLIYLDNGHISKIRSGSSRKNQFNKKNQQKKKSQNNNNPNRRSRRRRRN